MREAQSSAAVNPSQHAVQRTKNRLGISKKLAEHNAGKAFENGICHSEIRGQFKRYIDKLFFTNRSANNLRIYNRYVYVFAGRTLITVLPLPKRFYAAEDKLKKRRNKGEN